MGVVIEFGKMLGTFTVEYISGCQLFPLTKRLTM